MLQLCVLCVVNHPNPNDANDLDPDPDPGSTGQLKVYFESVVRRIA